MNLYIRFFESEFVATTIDEALDFLASIPDVCLDDYLVDDLRNYAEGNNQHPKRYKVNNRAYFIVIKTTAKTLDEFKAVGSAALEAGARRNDEKNRIHDMLNAINVGWYEARITFKRVMPIPGSNKFQYIDTDFAARIKAISIQDSYNKIIDHLRTRHDIDSRSQFPSVKGRNFQSAFLGMSPAN